MVQYIQRSSLLNTSEFFAMHLAICKVRHKRSSCRACYFYALFISDTTGDAQGFAGVSRVLIRALKLLQVPMLLFCRTR